MAANPQSGATRSVLTANYLLHTPESFVRTPLPGLRNGTAIIHASPELGARFLWFTVELEAGGSLAPAQHSRFFYLLEGAATVASNNLSAGGFAYSPPQAGFTLTAQTPLRCVILDKPYEPLPGTPLPEAFMGREDLSVPQSLNGVAGIEVRSLMPAGLAYDFAVNTMTYAPGAALPQVEIHYMEHGLLMLGGSGPYRLGDDTHQVQAGDFLWMSPYCPQWFQADSAGTAKYLIYKNFNRLPPL